MQNTFNNVNTIIMSDSKKEPIGRILRGQKDWRQWYAEVKTYVEIS